MASFRLPPRRILSALYRDGEASTTRFSYKLYCDLTSGIDVILRVPHTSPGDSLRRYIVRSDLDDEIFLSP